MLQYPGKSALKMHYHNFGFSLKSKKYLFVFWCSLAILKRLFCKRHGQNQHQRQNISNGVDWAAHHESYSVIRKAQRWRPPIAALFIWIRSAEIFKLFK